MRLPGEVTVLRHKREGAEAEKHLMPGRRNAPVSTQGERFFEYLCAAGTVTGRKSYKQEWNRVFSPPLLKGNGVFLWRWIVCFKGSEKIYSASRNVTRRQEAALRYFFSIPVLKQ